MARTLSVNTNGRPICNKVFDLPIGPQMTAWALVLALSCLHPAWGQSPMSQKRLQREKDHLTAMDQNKDGKLDPSEVSRIYKKRVTEAAEKAGLDATQPIPLDALFAALGGENSSGGGSGGAGGPSPANSMQPGNQDEQLEKLAVSTLRQHDKNEDGKLTGDEWKNLKDPKSGDKDSDGSLTKDEIKVWLASNDASRRNNRTGGGGSGGSSSSGSGGGSSSGSSSGSASAFDGKKSYRIKTAVEKLPGGLPDWFRKNDANADGQIEMSEYASDWSEDKAAEFDRYDKNGDGIIIASECLKAG